MFRCLESAVNQDFDSFEIIVVSDCSRGFDENGCSCAKIVRSLGKKSKVPIRFIEHSKNRGLIETRRTLFYASSGKWITQLDSDDFLAPGALLALYNAAISSNADIVHGTSVAGYFDSDGHFTKAKKNRYGQIHYGFLPENNASSFDSVFRNWLLHKEFTANTWGKLIRRELLTEAFNHIPYTECNMADDFLLGFFLFRKARSYIGIKEQVYNYVVNTGMSSARTIKTIDEWRLIASTASVFTVIATDIEESKNKNYTLPPLNEDEILEVKNRSFMYICNNITQLNTVVIPELRKEARAMLCDYWGEHFVCRAEQLMAE